MIQALERRGHDRVAAIGLAVSHEAQGQLKIVLSLAAEPRYLLLSLVTRHMAGSAERLFGQGLTPGELSGVQPAWLRFGGQGGIPAAERCHFRIGEGLGHLSHGWNVSKPLTNVNQLSLNKDRRLTRERRDTIHHRIPIQPVASGTGLQVQGLSLRGGEGLSLMGNEPYKQKRGTQ